MFEITLSPLGYQVLPSLRKGMFGTLWFLFNTLVQTEYQLLIITLKDKKLRRIENTNNKIERERDRERLTETDRESQG